MQTKGIISEIERYAIKDGPGIRTVVFLKGCPLKCRWCANPETQKSIYQLMYWKTRCIGCKQCVKACPNHALSFGKTGIEINRSSCLSCGTCVDTCNSQALTMAGDLRTVDEVVWEIIKDKPYYLASGGGVTFSGGEAACQGDFVYEVAKSCKEQKISTCIETCGYAEWSVYEKMLPYMDYFYYDLKLIDKNRHREYTGVSNKLILDNYCNLVAAGADMTVRIPIIPTVNNTGKNIQDTIGFLLKNSPGCHVSLLPYHRLGASKYNKLDMDYSMNELEPPSNAEMERIAGIFQKNGFFVTIGE